MPIQPPPPAGPTAGQPGHFPWTNWAQDVLVALSRTPTMAAGQQSVVPSAANVPTSVAVTFPLGRFTAPPNVVVGLNTTVPGTIALAVAATSVTATGFLLWVTRTNTTSTSTFWIASELGL